MSFFLDNPVLTGTAVLALLDLVLTVVLLSQLRSYRKRQAALTEGQDSANLSDVVLEHKQSLAMQKKNLTEIGKILAELADKNRGNIQKVGLVRFNPFADAGSNLSFSCALLDADGNGIVISSLHGRQGTRIYAKGVENGRSKLPLTDEEKQAISQAGKKQ